MIVMVVDGQGGGIGAAIIKGIRDGIGREIDICALGTNSIATSRMMKAGANRGATGENAIAVTCDKVDIIVGPLAVILPDSMMGEVTSRMAESICSCNAKKILIPLTQENVAIIGVSNEPLPHLVDKAVKKIKEII